MRRNHPDMTLFHLLIDVLVDKVRDGFGINNDLLTDRLSDELDTFG